jgi:hypothetical protein
VKTIRTTNGSFLTGTEIADAVTAYGLALARARELDVVDIPFVTDDGSVNRAEFRIGWQVETVVTADEQPADELIEVATIFDLLAKSRLLTASRGGWAALPVDTDWDEFI